MVQQTFQLQVMVLINANPQLAPIYLSQVRQSLRIPTVTDCLVDGADAGDGRRRQERPRQGDRAVDEGTAAEVEPLRFPPSSFGATLLSLKSPVTQLSLGCIFKLLYCRNSPLDRKIEKFSISKLAF